MLHQVPGHPHLLIEVRLALHQDLHQAVKHPDFTQSCWIPTELPIYSPERDASDNQGRAGGPSWLENQYESEQDDVVSEENLNFYPN